MSIDLFDRELPKWQIVKDGPDDRDWVILRNGQWRVRGLKEILEWSLPFHTENNK
jgi:hypothetical protein